MTDNLTPARVTVEIVQDDAGNVEVRMGWEPELMPGMELPHTHKMALALLEGTPFTDAARKIIGEDHEFFKCQRWRQALCDAQPERTMQDGERSERAEGHNTD